MSTFSHLRRCICTSAPRYYGMNKILHPGGFTTDGLKHWARQTNFGQDSSGQQFRRRQRNVNDETNGPYVDLYSEQIRYECCDYLKAQANPSDTLARAFFGSKHFYPERLILIAIQLFSGETTTSIPSIFLVKDRFLQWTVVSKTPFELILLWKFSSVKGLTMLAFDPALSTVYHGNCINLRKETLNRPLVAAGTSFHKLYAQFLLHGMVKELTSMITET